MKFWNRLRWFALAVFFLALVGLWVTESPGNSSGSGSDVVPAPKFNVTP
jgi:hypothetical protein